MERNLTAILAAGVAGYARRMGDDETGPRSRPLAGRGELVEGDSCHENHTDDDLLDKRGNAEQDKPVGQHTDQ